MRQMIQNHTGILRRSRSRAGFHMVVLCGLISAAVFLCGCSDDAPPPAAPRLVVEGHIDSDGYPDVLLNMSMVPSDSEGSVSESMIRWGVVTLSDGEREVILTGGPDNSYFPPYHYYTFDMKGEPGRTYTLHARYKDLSATSTVVMPSPTAIDRLCVTPVAGNDTLRHLTVKFRAPDDCPAYYHLTARVHSNDGRQYPCMLGAHEVVTPGAEVSLPVYRGHGSAVTGKYDADMPVGSDVTVTLARVSREVFLFWRAYDNASLVNGSIFVGAPGSLPSNVAGGYGVWSAQGVCTRTVKIE